MMIMESLNTQGAIIIMSSVIITPMVNKKDHWSQIHSQFCDRNVQIDEDDREEDEKTA